MITDGMISVQRLGEAYPELQALFQKLVIEHAKHSA
jgi:hypothetical protein